VKKFHVAFDFLLLKHTLFCYFALSWRWTFSKYHTFISFNGTNKSLKKKWFSLMRRMSHETFNHNLTQYVILINFFPYGEADLLVILTFHMSIWRWISSFVKILKKIDKNRDCCTKMTNSHNKFRIPILMLKIVTFESHNSENT